MRNDNPPAEPAATDHRVVVLFYKYFPTASGLSPSVPLHRRPELYMPLLRTHQHDLCTRLGMRGRVLMAPEGINGTLSCDSDETLQAYVDAMERLKLADCLGKAVVDMDVDGDGSGENWNGDGGSGGCRLFSGIDWKKSDVDDETTSMHREPFPDLKVSIVSEIVSTGGVLGASEIPQYGGKHLSPEEFHEELAKGGWVGLDGSATNKPRIDAGRGKEVVLIDVRNTFEHAVGHFVDPKTSRAAVDPEMTTFASFDATFCAPNAESLRDKKVLMYCTGGIRCEKASAMLRKRGVDDVSQLSGGIHRYLEMFGDEGLFRGKNFVFDQRVALAPTPSGRKSTAFCDGEADNKRGGITCVGRCLECSSPYDEISGARLCTVCRDLVLICPGCKDKLREYHCKRHAAWRDCYFTFLEVFDEAELKLQVERLTEIRDGLDPPSEHRNVRRTLMRQITKVLKQVKRLQAEEVQVDRYAPRRCRTCMDTEDICDGLCWGFWKHSSTTQDRRDTRTVKGGGGENGEEPRDQPIFINVGDFVEPGPSWNEIRHGPKQDGSAKKKGMVVEIKSWGSGGDSKDCVSVLWENDHDSKGSIAHPRIYRWGVFARNGKRLYDVQLFGNDKQQ